MGKLWQMYSVAERHKADVDFLLVYIFEAHPVDGWSIPGNYCIHSHHSIEYRALAAEVLTDHGILYPVVLDDMDNGAAIAYASSPERLYVILDGIIVYQGKYGPTNYKPAELDTFLGQLVLKIS
ncbi:type I iodothyronine deiodinase-like [Gigantopelta aegis]|uniref:type I iodothyronine deiodinase-like n=1 Tax=Gigantopelta aegis TaxID=1735272 RepID=UPI001B888421|nr:type I iodothyronine deiodinase-like [Gigantopelta aegis]